MCVKSTVFLGAGSGQTVDYPESTSVIFIKFTRKLFLNTNIRFSKVFSKSKDTKRQTNNSSITDGLECNACHVPLKIIKDNTTTFDRAFNR